ncbi:piercer of microtubule wall 1 protein [Phymastichus coffea]|uniref:piercer of microtubule wall 1 protein n=1 Tax=Phymastichus coffea TaxID=108790 RepID=UPI00273C898C|nr:piercer of microtubule wall 1 protein [Phymastichus coffea]
MTKDCGCDCNKSENGSTDDEPSSLPGPRTDEVYRTVNIPIRFMYPKLLKGYREVAGSNPHPCYRSTSTDYGWFSPTIHTVPTTYYPRNGSFSLEVSRGGMYRNCSLNTELDK